MVIFEHAIPYGIQKYLGKPDERVAKWAPLNTPSALIGIVTGYWSLLWILHKIMKNKKAYDLRRVLIFYNACQVLYSGYICKEIFMSAYLASYKLSCTPLDTTSKLGLRMAKGFWLFYISKIFDLSDTVFFMLRKKTKQVSFLHIYHHSSMIFNWYLGTLYLPGGQAFFSVLFNSFVHVIMYSYYMLSAMGPKVQKYLWWKKYLTQIQLIQFLMVMWHIMYGFYNNCQAPFWLTWFTVTYLCTLVALFCNFYWKAYRTQVESKPRTKKRSDRRGQHFDLRAAGDFKYK